MHKYVIIAFSYQKVRGGVPTNWANPCSQHFLCLTGGVWKRRTVVWKEFIISYNIRLFLEKLDIA